MESKKKWYIVYMYHGFGREGRRKRVRCMERVTWKFKILYVSYSQREFSVWLRQLKQGLYDNLEGWGGERDDSKDNWAKISRKSEKLMRKKKEERETTPHNKASHIPRLWWEDGMSKLLREVKWAGRGWQGPDQTGPVVHADAFRL